MDRAGLYQLFAKLGYKVGCEIGPEQGRNAMLMFENIPNLKLYGIDSYKMHPQASYIVHADKRHWDQDYWDGIKQKAVRRLADKDYTLIQKYSEYAIADIPDNSLDFVYLDADHSYDFVMQDIILWGRKIRKGGIISGHDYFNDPDRSERRVKVTQAVDDYVRVHGINFFITGEDHYKEKGDIYPSFFFVKEGNIWPNVIGFENDKGNK